MSFTDIQDMMRKDLVHIVLGLFLCILLKAIFIVATVVCSVNVILW